MADTIIFSETGKHVDLAPSDLPLLIHGAHGVGASIFSVVVVADMFARGNKFLFFTAYPMAREEFMKQAGEGASVFYLENESQIAMASGYQAIIVKSGDSELCLKIFHTLSDVHERIIFIKNIETILTVELFAAIRSKAKIILSGDIDQSVIKEEVLTLSFRTQIIFSPLIAKPEFVLPKLEKYHGYMVGKTVGVVSIKN